MTTLPELYFKQSEEWRSWLEKNHKKSNGIYLIFYKVDSDKTSMRWEEAVKVALCFGWIDSTVKKLDHERRRQYFCRRKPKSTWSKVNKTYIVDLIKNNEMHKSGHDTIKAAKDNGSWNALDDVENMIIPEDLQLVFNKNPKAFENYRNFARGYRKSYLYWLNQAKRKETRQNRIQKIIEFCKNNKKTPQ